MKRTYRLCILAAFALALVRVSADTLLATDVINSTNVDWTALLRAQKSVRSGRPVEIVLPSHPAASYAEIRRALWIAGLHGLTDQTSHDADTRRLMKPELESLKLRLGATPVHEVAVRDNAAAEDLLPLLVRAQVGCLLIGEEEPSSIKFQLTCQPNGVSVEGSDVLLPSLPFAVNFVQSSHADAGLVFEANGRVASDVFIRRFKDGTATVVNLKDETRHNLTYRHAFSRQKFDLLSAGVVHLLLSEQPRSLSRACNERFISSLWQVTFDGDLPTRVVDTALLPTVVPETYTGSVRYRTSVCMPTGSEMLFLGLDTNGSEAEVSIGGQSLGIRAWEPFEWTIPSTCRGKNSVPIEIRVKKRTLSGYLQATPIWRCK